MKFQMMLAPTKEIAMGRKIIDLAAFSKRLQVPSIRPPTYEVAIYFTELEPATRKAIQQYVASRLEEGVST